MASKKPVIHGADHRWGSADPVGHQWIYVGVYPTDPDTSVESPPFQNSWGNVGGGEETVRFRLKVDGGVAIEGAVEGGVSGTTVFTLPVGWRPEKDLALHCQDIDNHFYVAGIIYSDGRVVVGAP